MYEQNLSTQLVVPLTIVTTTLLPGLMNFILYELPPLTREESATLSGSDQYSISCMLSLTSAFKLVTFTENLQLVQISSLILKNKDFVSKTLKLKYLNLLMFVPLYQTCKAEIERMNSQHKQKFSGYFFEILQFILSEPF